MRKTLTSALAAVLAVAVLVAPAVLAQSAGGAFQPAYDYTLTGIWTWRGSSPVCFEGATVDNYQTCITPTDPTADRTWTLPNSSDTFVGSTSTQTLTNKTISSPVLSGTATGTYTLAGTPTITAPTITTPTITAPSTSSTGLSITKVCTLTETGAGTSYVCTIPVPAGAIIEDIQVIPRVLWNGTSASLTVGDTASSTGYFTATNLKATDLVVGEMLSAFSSTLWGGVEGAYLVAATGRRGPTSSNFGFSYVAGSNILFTVAAGAADGSAGRTDCVVRYHTGAAITQVVTP